MKRVIIPLSLFLGISCFSCSNSVRNKETSPDKNIEKEVVKTKTVKKEATIKPDTIIDGKHIYNLGIKKVEKKEISIEEAINAFDRGVNNAKSCEELIKACATFDADIRRISQKDGKVIISEVENRSDVKAIRKISEERSLIMCQTQQMR